MQFVIDTCVKHWDHGGHKCIIFSPSKGLRRYGYIAGTGSDSTA